MATAPAWSQVAAKKWRAAIIGCTGYGNYGHELDLAFSARDDIEVIAVADPNVAGRATAATRSKARRQYADYKQMLHIEKPELVCVAPRWASQHHAMTLAALRSGAHVYSEKPFTTNLEQADELIAVASERKLKIAVAHQIRLAPGILFAKKQLDAGLIGDLIEIHAVGKQDDRAGGEDMMVLGTHLFDLIRFFAGDALWCSAHATQNGRDITKADARTGKEDNGLIAGTEIHAMFGCVNGALATFTSHAQLRKIKGPWGLELIGSKGKVRINTDMHPQIFLSQGTTWDKAQTEKWERLKGDPELNAPVKPDFKAANGRVVNDWMDAIANNREPMCSGYSAMKAIEMVMAVYQSALEKKRVAIPLKTRQHPLAS